MFARRICSHFVDSNNPPPRTRRKWWRFDEHNYRPSCAYTVSSSSSNYAAARIPCARARIFLIRRVNTFKSVCINLAQTIRPRRRCRFLLVRNRIRSGNRETRRRHARCRRRRRRPPSATLCLSISRCCIVTERDDGRPARRVLISINCTT